MANLKTCPFCGGNELAWAFHLDYATVKCPKCRVHLVVGGKKYLTLAGAKKHYEPMLEQAWNRRTANTPCDLCRFNPPSSGDGKPCTMCVAERRAEDA